MRALSDTERAERDADERRAQADGERFIVIFADWLAARVVDVRAGTNSPDEEADRNDERANELARAVIAHLASAPWMLWRKFEILEHALAAGGCGWRDNREIAMLGAIKADVMRLCLEALDA